MSNNANSNLAKDFDINLYRFEKKKQTIDNKVKEKETNANKKIQINFKNSFVNEKTQHKYDKIIETNNKRNIEKHETMTQRNEMENVNQPEAIPEINESELIIIEGVTSFQKVLNDTDASILRASKANNVSKLKESGFGVDKQVSNNKPMPSNTDVSIRASKYIENYDEDNEVKQDDKIFDTIKYDYDYFSDGECDYTPSNKAVETSKHNESNHAYIRQEDNEYIGNNGPESEDSENRCQINSNDNNEATSIGNIVENNQVLDTNEVVENENIKDDIPEDIICEQNENNLNCHINYFGGKNDYDKFLEDTIGTTRKDDIQLKLRQQMKNIVHDMKDRKKEQKSLLENKKKSILDNLKITNFGDNMKVNIYTTEAQPVQKQPLKCPDLVRTDASKEISVKYYQKASKDNFEPLNISNKNIDSLLKETTRFDFNKFAENNLTFGGLNSNKPQKVEEYIYNVEEDDGFIHEENILDDIEQLNEEDVTSIHQSVRLESNDQAAISNINKGYNIDLDEFIKENTKHYMDDEIANYEELEGEEELLQNISHAKGDDIKEPEQPKYIDRRLLVFENCEDKVE
jgi:hypothetical protein